MEDVERIGEQLKSRAKERPLELHCAALDEDRNPKISKPNECFLFFMFNLCFACGQVGVVTKENFPFVFFCFFLFSKPEGCHETELESDCKKKGRLHSACRCSGIPIGLHFVHSCCGEFCITPYFGANDF